MSNVFTEEDLSLIHDYIHGPMLLDIVDNYLQDVGKEQITLKRILVLSTKALKVQINNDFEKVRKDLWHRNIRVWEDKSAQPLLTYRYAFGGHQEHVTMTREEAKAELSKMLGKYVNNLGEKLTNQNTRKSPNDG